MGRSEHRKHPSEFTAGLNLAVFFARSWCHVWCRVRRLAGGPGDAQSPWGRLRAASGRGGAAPKKSESPRRYWRRAVRPKTPPRRPCWFCNKCRATGGGTRHRCQRAVDHAVKRHGGQCQHTHGRSARKMGRFAPQTRPCGASGHAGVAQRDAGGAPKINYHK